MKINTCFTLTGLRVVKKLPAKSRVKKEMCADFLRRAGQSFQIGERSSIFEAAKFPVTHAALRSLCPVN